MTKLPAFIEVETNTYCNRVCSWCPNGHSPRGHDRRPIADEVWDALLTDLGRHGYSGWFAFHNYNEPLASPKIFTLIDGARATLPEAKLALYTNGDYRRNGELDRLVSQGVDVVRVTLYPHPHAKPPSSKQAVVDAFTAECFPGVATVARETPRGYEANFVVQNTRFVIVVPAVERYTNRALSVTTAPRVTRRGPCFLPDWSAAVDVWGNLKLCSQIFDVRLATEAAYRIGNVVETPFMELWTGERMNTVRHALAEASFHGLDRCAGCDHALLPAFEQAARRRYADLTRA